MRLALSARSGAGLRSAREERLVILGQRLEKRPDKGLFGSYEDSNLSLGVRTRRDALKAERSR